jgi:hypothetical protein
MDALADELEAAQTPAQVRDVLTRVGAGLMRGTVPPTTAKILTQLGNTILRSMDADLEADLQEIKQALEDHEDTRVQAWSRRRRKK